MNIISKLTLRHLRLNRGRTAITIIGIMLSVSMICAVAGFVLSVRDVMRQTLIESRGDYHVAYIGVTAETAAKLAEEGVFSSHYTKENGESQELMDIYLRLEKPGRDYRDTAEALAERYHIQQVRFNTELLAIEGAIAQDNVMKAFITVGAIAVAIVIVGSVIVIANAFYISSQERVRQFGLLKSVGATSGQIGRSILFEAFALAVIAIPLGIALGFLIQAAVLSITNDLLTELNAMNNNAMNFRVFFDPAIIWISVGLSAVTLLISAWRPARKAAKTSAIDAIRRTQDIKIRPRQLKTSRLTQLVFGIEGTLAAKSLKRSRGKYRATVIALTVSIIMFISVYSVVWVMNKAVEMEYGGYNFDALIGTSGGLSVQDEMQELLSTIPDAEIIGFSRIYVDARVPNGFITENALNSMSVENGYGLLLYSMPDAEFMKISPMVQEGIPGILINTTGTFHEDGKAREAVPYAHETGTELIFDNDSVTISAITGEIPEAISPALFDGSLINILIPETVYRELVHTHEKEGPVDTDMYFAVTTKDSKAFCAAAEELLLPFGQEIMVLDVSEMTRLNRNITLIISLFGYGFIAMLSLIAVTSVVATISTNMALRRQEFAMLYSAGMTPKGMNKMLNLESLLYGFKSLVIGLPIGIVLSYLIYLGISAAAEFAWQPPWSAIAISAAAVLLLTFGTMRYGKNKLNKVSIVEAIRSETA